MNRKFLFVNTDSEIEEEVLSVSSSAGAGDSGKLATLDSNGKWDVSMIPDVALGGVDWKDSCRVAVETNVNIASPGASLDGVSMNNGDRVLLTGQTTASQNGIYVFNGAASAMTRATDADEDSEVTSQLRTGIEEGTRANFVAYLTTNDPIVVDTTNLSFSFQDPSALVGGDGIDITGATISVDLSADSGLEFATGQLQINFAVTSVVGDLDGTNGSLAIKAEDLYSNGANQGAKILGGDPANISQSSATTIQGILDDLSAAILDNAQPGIDLTAGAGGVTKGDLIYISANDTGLPLDITTANTGIGLADSTVAAAASFEAVQQGLLTGVLVGATAGTKYFWDGSALTSTAPSAGGSRVWQVGVAKNATDLIVDIQLVKKNS